MAISTIYVRSDFPDVYRLQAIAFMRMMLFVSEKGQENVEAFVGQPVYVEWSW